MHYFNRSFNGLGSLDGRSSFLRLACTAEHIIGDSLPAACLAYQFPLRRRIDLLFIETFVLASRRIPTIRPIIGIMAVQFCSMHNCLIRAISNSMNRTDTVSITSANRLYRRNPSTQHKPCESMVDQEELSQETLGRRASSTSYACQREGLRGERQLVSFLQFLDRLRELVNHISHGQHRFFVLQKKLPTTLSKLVIRYSPSFDHGSLLY